MIFILKSCCKNQDSRLANYFNNMLWQQTYSIELIFCYLFGEKRVIFEIPLICEINSPQFMKTMPLINFLSIQTYHQINNHKQHYLNECIMYAINRTHTILSAS